MSLPGEIRSTGAVRKELLRSLQGLRGTLAVTVARERKRLPQPAWEAYLQTEDRARSLLRSIRSPGEGESDRYPAWVRAVQELRDVSAKSPEACRMSETEELCRRLAAVLDCLDGSGA